MQDLNSSTKTLMNFGSELCMKVLHRLFLVLATAVLGNPDFKKISLFGKHFLNKAWIVHCDSSKNKGVYCG